MHFSLEEVMALPEGGNDWGREERVINSKSVQVPVLMRQIGCFYVDDTTPLTRTESDGQRWRLGRYVDGEWFKRRVYL